MRLDSIAVELRPRSPWEAGELGIALVRANAATLWRAWLLATLPVFALCNLVAWQLDLLPWAALAMWWLKPVFDRIPLFVLSRAVFGAAPTVRETLAAQRTWGWRPMLHYLTWRRLGPTRSLFLPVDLLEGGGPKGARRAVIAAQGRGVAAMTTLVFVNFEIALTLAVLSLAPLFVPLADLFDTVRAVSDQMFVHQPDWAKFLANAIAFLAMSAMEPFYVGAGFGLYLNRRTQLEAWDVEIAFRRLRARAGATLVVACLAIGMLLPLRPAMADDADAPPPPTTTTLPAVFGERYVPAEGFERAVDGTADDALLHPTEKRTVWTPRDKDKPKAKPPSPYFKAIAAVFAAVVEYGLWIAIALLVLLLLATAKRWWPWMADTFARDALPPTPIAVAPTADPEAMPADVAGAARRLWAGGLRRRALALVYRAAVEGMVLRTGALLVPGATESEVLRAARALRDQEDRDAFAGAVRMWQYAAYADRMPDTDAFEALLARLSQRFGWEAAA